MGHPTNKERSGPWSRRDVLATGTLLAALRSGAYAQERAVYLSDFSQCRPPAALSRTPQRHRWRLLDYASDKAEGVMLVAGHNTAAPEITLPLNRKGWYAIHFGLRSRHGESRIEARLDSDSTFALITHNDVVGRKQNRKDYEIRPTHFDTGTRIDDLFWKIALGPIPGSLRGRVCGGVQDAGRALVCELRQRNGERLSEVGV